jgi:hypothetical protein
MRKRSKKIFTSGYFSMKGVLDILTKMGHKVYVTYPEEMSGIEDTEFVLFAKEIDVKGERSQEYLDMAMRCLNNLTVGGHTFEHHEYARNYVANWFVKSFYQADHIIEEYRKLGKMDMVIVHNDHCPTYGGLAGAARQDGVPVFCLYNGFSSFLHPIVGGMDDYRFGNHYCLNGQFVVDYLKPRIKGDFKGKVTGCAVWDIYYQQEADREPNTFLYNPTVNFEETSFAGMTFAVPTGVHPWTYMLRPPYTDEVFYRGFAKFQKEVNPDAKLWITMRPFHMAANAHHVIAEHQGVKNVTPFLFTDRPFRQLIQNCEYFVGGISSTIQEAIITRTPTVFLCGTEPAEDFFQSREAYVETIIDEDSIVEALTLAMQEKSNLIEACDDRAEYYNYGDDGLASERSVEYILEVLGE